MRKLNTYVINLPNRKDRLTHILDQFEGYDYFNLIITAAIRDSRGSIGLWKTVKEIFKTEANNDGNEYFLICEDDHLFTDDFDINIFINQIEIGINLQVDVLLGGVSSGRGIIKYNSELIWLDSFSGTQFMIIYKKFIPRFLESEPIDDHTIDSYISDISLRKMCFHPFISIQEDFGYSDATDKNNDRKVSALFISCSDKINMLKKVHKRLHGGQFLSKSIQRIGYYILSGNNLVVDRERYPEISSRTITDNLTVRYLNCDYKTEKLDIIGCIQTCAKKALEDRLDCFLMVPAPLLVKELDLEYIITKIKAANKFNASILLFNCDLFNEAIGINDDLFWIDDFGASDLVVIYSSLYKSILQLDKKINNIKKLSDLTSNKFLSYPFLNADINNRFFNYDRDVANFFIKESEDKLSSIKIRGK